MPISGIGDIGISASLYTTTKVKDSGGASALVSQTEADSDEKKKAALAKGNAALSEFSKYAKMSPIERIRYNYLKDHNLTEESLAALPADERKKIEDEIAAIIKKAMEQEAQKKGLNVNIEV